MLCGQVAVQWGLAWHRIEGVSRCLIRFVWVLREYSKKEYKVRFKELINKLVVLQQEAKRQELGVVVLFEGWKGAGKGSRISDLLYHLDARTLRYTLRKISKVKKPKTF